MHIVVNWAFSCMFITSNYNQTPFEDIGSNLLIDIFSVLQQLFKHNRIKIPVCGSFALQQAPS